MRLAQWGRIKAPQALTAAQPGDQIVDHVGGEGTGDPRFDVTLAAVVEQRSCRFHLGCGVGQVVGEGLVGIGAPAVTEVADCCADNSLSEIDDIGGGVQIGNGHDGDCSEGRCSTLIRSTDSLRFALIGWQAVAMSSLGPLIRPARICVYCGSNVGSVASFHDAAQALGEAMARRGIGLVYGGGHVGLMGVVADAVLAGGGEVIGVITDQLVSAEVAHRGLSSLEVVPDMHQRKARFEQLSDGFIALPGGFGTVEETIEMITWNQLKLVRKPVVLLDVDQFWTGLFDWIEGAVEAGFVRTSHRMLAQRAHTVDEALALALAPAPETPNKWIDRDTGQVPINLSGPIAVVND